MVNPPLQSHRDQLPSSAARVLHSNLITDRELDTTGRLTAYNVTREVGAVRTDFYGRAYVVGADGSLRRRPGAGQAKQPTGTLMAWLNRILATLQGGKTATA